MLSFAAQSADTDVINLILTDVPDTDPTNAGQLVWLVRDMQ